MSAVLDALAHAITDLCFKIGSIEYLRPNGCIGSACALLKTTLSMAVLTLPNGKVDSGVGDRRAFRRPGGALRAFSPNASQPDEVT